MYGDMEKRIRSLESSSTWFWVGFAIVFAWLALTGCGQVTSDAQFEKHKESFQREAAARDEDVSLEGVTIVFDETLPEPHYAGCYGKEIRVRPSYWESATESARELLIFHELGHCALGLEHSFNPWSIMHAEPDPIRYEWKRTRMLDDLFGV